METRSPEPISLATAYFQMVPDFRKRQSLDIKAKGGQISIKARNGAEEFEMLVSPDLALTIAAVTGAMGNALQEGVSDLEAMEAAANAKSQAESNATSEIEDLKQAAREYLSANEDGGIQWIIRTQSALAELCGWESDY